MDAPTTTGSDFHGITRSKTAPVAMDHRPRYISPKAGHAMEILGHAIVYLSHEFARGGEETVNPHDPQLEAILLLMALNSQVYYACPVIPTFSECLRSLFRATPREVARNDCSNPDLPDFGVQEAQCISNLE